MTNSTGFFKKIQILLFSGLTVFIYCLFFSSQVSAANSSSDIKTTVSIKYLLAQQKLTAEYTISTTSSSNYPTVLNYNRLLVPFKDISNTNVISSSGNYSVSTSQQDANTEILIDYKGEVVKADHPLTATLTFSIDNLTSGNAGQINKLILPVKFAKDIAIYSLEIEFENSIGSLQYSSERPSKISTTSSFTSLQYDNPVFEYISIVLGPVISYDFTIIKELSNDTDSTLNFDINVPRSQFNQTQTFTKISPSPSSAFTDKDSNVFFRYTLSPKEKVNLEIQGNIAIEKKFEPQILSTKEITTLTQNDGYWEFNDQNELKRFELYLRKNQVEFDSQSKPVISDKLIHYSYQYVIDRLTIKELSKDSSDNLLRGGATLSLQRKTESSSDDYADLLISLLRKYGIPAEMVVGYVTPVNTASTGYYHTWIQCWTKDQGWQLLDPALDDLTDKDLYGSEYFDHVAVIARGSNSISPKLPSSAPTDYTFQLATSTPDIHNEVSIDANTNSVMNYSQFSDGYLNITNLGNSIIQSYNLLNTKLVKYSINQDTLIVPGQKVSIPVRYALEPTDRFSNKVAINGQISFTNLSTQNFQSVFSTSIIIEKNWWWEPLIIASGIAISTIAFTLMWLLVKKFNIIKMMKTSKTNIKSVAIVVIAITSLFSYSPVHAQTVTMPNPDVKITTDTTTTSTTQPKNIDFTIEIEVGTQSAWDGSVQVTAKFMPSDNVSKTEVKWDVPLGLKYSENYTNYFPTEKDNVYTATTTIYPVNSGTYDIAANITAWEVNTNKASSKKVTIEFDKNLVVTPSQPGYQAGVMVKYVVMIIIGIAVLGVAFFLGKKAFKKFAKWFMPPEA